MRRGSEAMTEQEFLKDVADHKMTILRDEGVNRHIRFRRPKTISMGFDVLTWPGHLCYTGDMGTYVFQRLNDMFEFFRGNNQNGLFINPRYWAEKLEATDCRGGHEEFDECRFNRAVLDRLIEWIREHRHDTDRDSRRELWDAVMDEVIRADADNGGHRKQIAAYDFHHRVTPKLDFRFADLWETNFNAYTHHFIWCCYAIAWSIRQYDNAERHKN